MKKYSYNTFFVIISCIIIMLVGCSDGVYDEISENISSDEENTNDDFNSATNQKWDFRVSGYLQPNSDDLGLVDLFIPAMIDTRGDIWDVMDVDKIHVYEDGMEVDFKKEPISKSKKAKLDLMVVLDSTDSMTTEIANVNTSVNTLATSLDATYDMRFGGVAFRDWDGVNDPNYVEQVSSCDDQVSLGRIFSAGGAYLQAFNVAQQPATLTSFRYRLYNGTHKERPMRLFVIYENESVPSGPPIYVSGDITAHNNVPVGDWVEIDLSNVAVLQNNPIRRNKIWIGMQWQYGDGPCLALHHAGNCLPACNPDNIYYSYNLSTYGNSSHNGSYHFQATFEYPTEAVYDDGSMGWHRYFNAGGRYVQGFTPPFYPCIITGFRYMLANNVNDTNPTRIVVNYNNTSTTTPPYTDVYYSGDMDLSGTALTWLDVDLSGVASLKNNPIKTGKVWIGYEWQTDGGPDLAADTTRISPHPIDDIWYSYSYQSFYNKSGYRGTWMIRPIFARPTVSAAHTTYDELEFSNLNPSRTHFNNWISGIEVDQGQDCLTEGALAGVAKAWLKAGWRTGAALERYLVVTDAPMHQIFDNQFDDEHGVTWLLDDVCDMFDSSASIGWGPGGTGRDGYAWVVSPASRDNDGDGLREYYNNSYGRYIEDPDQGTGTYQHKDPRALATCAGEWINLGNGTFAAVKNRIGAELEKGGFLTFESWDPETTHDVTVQIELPNGEYAEHTWENVSYAPFVEENTEEGGDEDVGEIVY